MLMSLLTEINPLNAKKKVAEIEALLDEYIPRVEQMKTKLKKYDAAYKTLKTEIPEREKKLDDSKESTRKKLEISRKLQEYEELKKAVEICAEADENLRHSINGNAVINYLILNLISL